MADRTVATTDTLDTLRTTYNSTAGDVGDISGVTGASGIIADATDIVEAITLMNTEVNAIKAGTSVFETKITFEGATAVATQQSIKAYVDAQTLAHDLDIAPDSGSAQSIILDTESLTFSGGTGIDTVGSGNTLTMNISNVVATLTGTQTFTNKTFTSPTISAMTFSSGQATSGLNIGATGIVFEGATADAYETTLTVADPTADRVITIPNSTMTAVTTATHTTKGKHIVMCMALG